MTARRDIVHPPIDLALKVATRAAVRGCGGTDAAGATAGVRQQRISDCCNPNTGDFLRIDEAAAIEDVTVGQPGWPWVARALAARQGFALVALQTDEAPTGDWLAGISRCATDVGQLMSLTAHAVADGRVDADEAFDIDTVVDEALAGLMKMRALARAVRG